MFYDCTYIIVGILKANTYLLQCHFKKVHIRNRSKESEDERRARVDEKNIGNGPACFLMGIIFVVESERAKRTHCCTLIDIFVYIVEKWFPLKSEWGHSLYFFNLVSSLLSCSFYLLDQRKISGVDLLEMTWKDCHYGYLPGL